MQVMISNIITIIYITTFIFLPTPVVPHAAPDFRCLMLDVYNLLHNAQDAKCLLIMLHTDVTWGGSGGGIMLGGSGGPRGWGPCG